MCSHFVAEAQPFFGIGRAFGQEVVERLDNCRLVLGRCRIEQLSAFGAVDDDAYLVFFLQLVNQDAEAFLTSSRRFSWFMDPEMSITKTRLAYFRFVTAISLPFIPMRSRS